MSLLKPYHKDAEDPSQGELRRTLTVVVTAHDKDMEYILADWVIRKRSISAYNKYFMKRKNLPKSEATWKREEDLWKFEEQIQKCKHESETRTPRA